MKKFYQQELFRLWTEHALCFQNLVDEYNKLIAEKRKRKILPIRPLPKPVIREFPKNDFLEIKTAEGAEMYLENLDEKELKILLNKVDNILRYNYSYITMRNRVCDLRHQIRRSKK